MIGPGPGSVPTRARRRRKPRSLSDIAVRDEAKEVRPDARPQDRKNRRCIRWNTLRIFSGRERRRWLRIVRRSRKVNVGQAPLVTLYGKSRPTGNDLFGDHTHRFNYWHEEERGRPGSLWEIVTATSWLPRHPVCPVDLVCFVYLVHLVYRLVWFNQINKTNQTNQTNKTGWR